VAAGIGQLPAVGGAGLTLDTVVTLPLLPNGNQAVLRAFDISWVDGEGKGKGNGKGNGAGDCTAARF
jgi:hypothetical protein